VTNTTGVTILQHPRERFHPIGTARIAKLGLSKVDLQVVWKGFHADPQLFEKIPANAGLLFPSSKARNLASISPREQPKHLVVLDGTWSTARALFRSQPNLATLPHYFLAPDAPSQYRIRKEPRAEYRSTIEAIWQALRILEPTNTTLDGLMETFNAMIQAQVDFALGKDKNPRPKRANQRPSRTIPNQLTSAFDNIVVAYGEFLESPEGSATHHLFYWAALRPSTGETFSALLRPTLSPRQWQNLTPYLEKMDIPIRAFEKGLSLRQFTQAWSSFFAPTDTLATWNQITHKLFDNFLPQTKEPICLKEVYCNHIRGRCGDLMDVLRNEQLQPKPVSSLGRSSTRLANAACVAEFLHAVKKK
tara:strand:- start:25 stop:1110 length:1086 start_codon:yes stop_codon:yes gene_type:complete